MSVKDLSHGELPASDFHEVACRLGEVARELEEANDDWTRQEIYDRIGMAVITIYDVIEDITAIERVMRAVVDA